MERCHCKRMETVPSLHRIILSSGAVICLFCLRPWVARLSLLPVSRWEDPRFLQFFCNYCFKKQILNSKREFNYLMTTWLWDPLSSKGTRAAERSMMLPGLLCLRMYATGDFMKLAECYGCRSSAFVEARHVETNISRGQTFGSNSWTRYPWMIEGTRSSLLCHR